MTTFNTRTLITWGSYEDQYDNLDLDNVRVEKLQEMIAAGKTDGGVTVVSPTVTERFFLDAASAQEYIYFMEEQATLFGSTIVSAIVQENAR
jgi:hypothetical protein